MQKILDLSENMKKN